MKASPAEPLHAGTKLIVRVLQDVVRAERFESYADLTEALKCRLARLKIPYRSDVIQQAIDRLECGGQHQLIQRPLSERQRLVERPAEPEIINRPEAKRLYDWVMRRSTPRPEPQIVQRGQMRRPMPVRTLDRLRASRMMWQSVLDQIQVCETLEATPPQTSAGPDGHE
jgi:hypothetical protein